MTAASQRSRLRTEFAVHAAWVAEEIARAPLDDRVPPACRCPASPVLLARLADLLDLRSGTRVLDGGCGIGGPAAWLRRERGCEVIGIDVFPETVGGLRALFPSIPAAVADCGALPFARGAFDAAWTVGVLDCAASTTILPELARVVRPGGRFASYTLCAVGTVGSLPAANELLDPRTLAAAMTAAGFTITTAGPVGRLARPPAAWRDACALVDAMVQARHKGSTEFAAVERERRKVRTLLASPAVEAWMFGLRR